MSMSSTYQGDALDIMIYGESHSEAIGVYINGLPEDVMLGPHPEKKLTKLFSSATAQCFTDISSTQIQSPRTIHLY